ncbi:MAG TPA: (Fe-S)-binding protein [Gemmatimonadaceae bacterium]
MRVSLFATCLGDQFFAESVADCVRLLRSLDVDVSFPAGQTCCGQPAWNAGYREEALAMARHTVRVFEGSAPVVLPSGSCAAMLRVFYPQLAEREQDGFTQLAQRTFELSEFLVKVLGVTTLGDGLRGMRVAYHHGCHALRELGVEKEPTALLAAAGAEVVPWIADRECCGFGGTFAVKHPSVSAAMADRKLDTLPSPDCLTSADGGCLLQLAGRSRLRGMSVTVRPLASLLWQARQASLSRPGA